MPLSLGFDENKVLFCAVPCNIASLTLNAILGKDSNSSARVVFLLLVT